MDTTTPEHPEMLSVAEAAKLLRKHPRTVERLCRNGKLPARKFGTWLIFRDQLMKPQEKEAACRS